MNATLALTDEQLDALDGFRSGETLKVVAGAGAGKTSTLLAMADSMPDGATGRYLAFNRSIVDEAKRKMPDHIVASTVHSLAFAGIDERFKDRVTRDRMPSFELARRYRVMPMTFRIDGHANGELHALTNNQVASLAYRGVTRFCESADLVPAACHVPHVPALDWVDDRGRRHCENNDAIAAALVPLMNRMWADISNPHGPVPVSLDHVVKLYELSDFDLGIDVLLMDEAQDVNAVFASICMKQMARGTQLVAVGDENQAIYGWRGAIDAFKLLPAATRTATLSLSFRFGPAIAEVANIPLAELGADLRIRGNPAKDSKVGPVKVPDAFLCRTNATAVEKYLEVTRRGFRTHLMGGASEMLSFARAAEKLQAGRTVEHPDLGGFADWAEVGAYVRNDPSGRDLATSYDLVEQFGAAKLVKALSGLSKTPRPGEVIVSTAHKAKGREWPTVRLADDFAFHHPDRPVISDEELRLLYVAATRAQDVLAVDRTRYFNPRHQGAGSCR
jgi:hypothetical protein